MTHDTSTWPASLRAKTAGPAPACATLVGDHRAAVAVVSAGFTGLLATLHLAEAGYTVRVRCTLNNSD